MNLSFSISRLPRIEFGAGSILKIPAIAAQYGTNALLVTGTRSFQSSTVYEPFCATLKESGINWKTVSIGGEPSPQAVDGLAGQYRGQSIDVVIAIGGGSVLDAAKAIAGLLRVDHSVMDFLEGVGPELAYPGPAVPFIAAPTTAGTGSEATKNAVLGTHGPDGFKKSFRDDQLVAKYAVLDPDLLATCPKPQIAANGMDALTQLIESYVSTRSNRMTDTLALSGIEAVGDGLLDWYHETEHAVQGRTLMHYAALLSGICLAQTGLGAVHGLASPLGAFHPIPHGVACGTLVAACTRKNIECMREREPENPALRKYGRIGEVLSGQHFENFMEGQRVLLSLLDRWTDELELPSLGSFGIDETSIEPIIANCRGSSMKTNPITLTDDEIRDTLINRL